MSRFITLALSLLLFAMVGEQQQSFGQSCGCDKPACDSCQESCGCVKAKVTLHIKSADCGCEKTGCKECGCKERCRLGCCRLFRRPTINIEPATQPVTTAAPVITRMAYQPVAFQTVAFQPMAIQSTAFQAANPAMLRMVSAGTQAFTKTQNETKCGSDSAESVDGKIAELANEVNKVSSRVNDLIVVVDKHDQILKSLVDKATKN